MTGGPPLPIALIGMGRMGREIDALSTQRGCTVVARLDVTEMQHGLTSAMLNGAHVAIDFTLPGAAVANATACLALGCPVVIGTTGWHDQIDTLQQAVARYACAALWSPNFSLGVQLFLAGVEDMARRMRQAAGFDVHVVETHHAAKVDAPSGTGIAVGARVEAGWGRAVGISSVRVGSVPGTHEVIFDAPFEQIRMVHEARDRRVFADGALTAARWLSAQQVPALYTMQDMFATTNAVPDGDA